MNWKNTSDRYGSLSIGMHWLVLVLLVGVYACIELREFFPKDSDPREALKTWHFMLGLSVFALVFLRLVLRFFAGPAPSVPELLSWQKYASVVMHWVLYAFLVVMPLLGWLTLSAKGKAIPYFGLELPALIGGDELRAEQLEDIHETVGTVGYYLIGLHVLAALFHHYVLRDGVLLRMLPQRRGVRRTARP